MTYLLIDGDKFKTKKELHQFLKENLDFPDYYGMNADALWDMLTTWIDFSTTIEWINYDKSLEFLGKDAEITLSVFRSAERELNKGNVEFILKYREEKMSFPERKTLIIEGNTFKDAFELYPYIVTELNLRNRCWATSERLWDSFSEKYDLPVTIKWINFKESRKKLGKDADEMVDVLLEIKNILKSFELEVSLSD
ncbi:barstar family protein [Methanococcus sp. CF]